MRRGLLGVMGVALLLGGCAGLFNPAAEWPRVGDEFVQRLRWREYAGAAAYVAEERRSDFLVWTAALAPLQVVDGRIESFVLKDQDRRAEAIAVLDYYRLPSARLQRWQLTQQWEYRGGGTLTPGDWQLVGALPTPPE